MFFLEVLVPNTAHKFSPKVLQKPPETKPPNQHQDLTWPIYVLRGDGSIFWVVIDLNKRLVTRNSLTHQSKTIFAEYYQSLKVRAFTPTLQIWRMTKPAR